MLLSSRHSSINLTAMLLKEDHALFDELSIWIHMFGSGHVFISR